MTTMKAPTGAFAYGFGDNVSRFALAAHTQALPRTLSYTRKPTNSAGNAGYSIKVIYGITQLDGTIAYALAEVTLRTVPNMTDTDRTNLWAGLVASTAGTQATVAAELMKTQVLPSPTDISV